MSWSVDFFSTTVGTETLLFFSVILFETSKPLSKASLIVSSNVNIPFADPIVFSFCLDLSGTNASIFSLNLDLFPDCDAKWIDGVQKPDTQIQSHSIFSMLNNSFLSSDILAISADLTFL